MVTVVQLKCFKFGLWANSKAAEHILTDVLAYGDIWRIELVYLSQAKAFDSQGKFGPII